jgi:hypothetical protein
MTSTPLATLDGALRNIGFVGRAQRVYLRPLVDGVAAWLGLNVATRGGLLQVNPVVGVRHEPLEGLLGALRPSKAGSRSAPVASVTTPLGQLMPERRLRLWAFHAPDERAEVGAVVSDLMVELDQWATPFQDQASTLVGLRAAMEQGYGYPFENGYRLPLTYLLENDSLGCLRALAEGSARWGIGASPAALQYRAFAERVRARLQHV